MFRCLMLMSGGLDSALAAKVIMEAGLCVTAIAFKTPFFEENAAVDVSKELGIELIINDFSHDFMAMLKCPKHGYGKNMNPCIDCHSLMARKAMDLVRKGDFDFIATGEVLDERPMSQNRGSLEKVSIESGANDLILRPLSALLLDPTKPESMNWIERNKLLDISGRSRHRQLEMAEQFGLKKHKPPGGGCLLTEPAYSERLRQLLGRVPSCLPEDAELIKHGRLFWSGSTLGVLGRNACDNAKLRDIAMNNDILIKESSAAGPTLLVRRYYEKGELDYDLTKSCAGIIGRYGKKKVALDPCELSIEYV